MSLKAWPVALAVVAVGSAAGAQDRPDEVAPSAVPLNPPVPGPSPRPAPPVYVEYPVYPPSPFPSASATDEEERPRSYAVPDDETWWQARERRHPHPPGPRAWFFRAESGGLYERLYARNVLGGSIALSADNERGVLAFSIGGYLADGRMDPGYNLLRVGYESLVTFKIGVVRLGFGVGFGGATLSTTTHESTGAFTLDGSLVVTVDLVNWYETGNGALFLSGRLLLSGVLGNEEVSGLWGPTLGLGVRL